MRCAWQAYLNLLPHWMRQEVDRFGQENLQELRIRTGLLPQMLLKQDVRNLSRQCGKEDIAFVINAASEYSPWAARTLASGFLTAPGGHRIGVCGVATVSGERMTGISQPTSLCLRVARDFEGIAGKAADISGSILIIGPPGSGKTTLLRDLIRTKANVGQGSVSVVDEREELFPLYRGQTCFSAGNHTDILSGCRKAEGIEAVLRSMNPEWIAVDEITCKSDCDALLQAGWCGVSLMATAHAGSLNDLKTRPVYKPLIDYKLFSTVLILRKDKSWTMERMHI
ncbi:MAG: Flp pilus assembly complex ATPase component TadA [Oscillospiraceae bacterium]|nr:Flp pilus assembly complex ATPase component TadA [Oscillospiraceae bacterium]